eukprot:TRINITY_DN38475_c0_g2_i1.p1 TRINITY_DN38475_c0_g2~~TRINITY_DN38475_c0_g2_i1.p1  ORF type:complete len:186 (+),score=18.16 TRINITY_DN38475_c0_g2_i1:101-658(+)
MAGQPRIRWILDAKALVLFILLMVLRFRAPLMSAAGKSEYHNAQKICTDLGVTDVVFKYGEYIHTATTSKTVHDSRSLPVLHVLRNMKLNSDKYDGVTMLQDRAWDAARKAGVRAQNNIHFFLIITFLVFNTAAFFSFFLEEMEACVTVTYCWVTSCVNKFLWRTTQDVWFCKSFSPNLIYHREV